jgi:hypothetical protein
MPGSVIRPAEWPSGIVDQLPGPNLDVGSFPMHEDLITHRPPPPNRVRGCEGGVEQHLSEGAVMLAFAMHLLRTAPGVKEVAIHPDGEHGKRFDFEGWLGRRDFRKLSATGKTSYGGTYVSAAGETLIINPIPGHGDVVAKGNNGQTVVAECKGGIINTRHAGQLSRLRRGLCEAVGLSLAKRVEDGTQQFAVVPHTRATEELARRMAARASAAGIGIALVDGMGRVTEMASV